MSNNKAWKDAWIRDAILSRYIIVKEDGTVFRAKRVDDKGNPVVEAGYSKITVQTHKKSGRVYFNMKFRGISKSVLLNRVVALRYHPNPLNLEQVNHKDGNKQHNAKDNLEWASGSDNEKHAHRTGLKSGRGTQNSNSILTPPDVLAIRASQEGPTALAKRYGVSRSTINNVLKGKTWTHI